MLTGLDSGSAYISAAEFRDMGAAADSRLGGIGIEVARRGDQVVVVAPLEGTPSERAGLRAGDVVLAIDGKPLDDKLWDVMTMLRGEPGTEVRLRVRRKDRAEPVDLQVKRERLDIRSVKRRSLGDHSLYLRISSFTTETANDIERELGRARREMDLSPPRRLVLDLRNNPGGVLDSAVKTADLFIEEGMIVRLRGRAAESAREFNAKPGAVPGRPRIAVLVNGGSAAASEILASALRKHAGAVILGRRTFGRGSIQTIMPLQNDGALKLTTARWHDAEGNPIEGKGLAPDIELANPPDDLPVDAPDPWIERALQVVRQETADRRP